MSKRHFLIVMVILLGANPNSASAFNLGKLIKQATEGMETRSAGNPSAPLTSVQGVSNTSNKVKADRPGNSPTMDYCRRTFSVAGLSKKNQINESLVLEEFKLNEPRDFFDIYIKAPTVKLSHAFPSPDYYQGEFETDRINVLYDLLLSYPSSQYLAALIAEARKESSMPQYDHQAKVDALSALAMLHFHLRDWSKNPNRWKELALQLQSEEHYTAHVISARLLASGELGVKDMDRALFYALDANSLRNKYSSEEGFRTMSSRNYARTSNRTVFDIVVANPKSPHAKNLIQFAQQYAVTLKNPVLVPELEGQFRSGLASIEKSASSAAKKAQNILDSAQKGALIKAEKNSLDNATRNRVSDSPNELNVDSKTMMLITRQLEKINILNDQEKQLFASALVDAHDSGDKAIAMMPIVLNSAMNLMMNRGIGAMPAIEPYVQQIQRYSDNACSIVSRWDQAAQVTKSTEGTANNSMADLLAESGH